ncbi:MAG: TetR/AcrR family transcriptional regulator [Devosia sp.]|nr:TetR/AcrR family transcriptional regulator [Devosia sp.]
MEVSEPTFGSSTAEARGARARTRKLMLETATALMQRGETPSVSAVAEAAEVSRATAYRYFPSQAALVQAVVDEGLGPILDWTSTSTDAEARVLDLFALSMPRILEFEATFKAALKLSLEQWAQRRAGTLGAEPPFKRGHRVELLQKAIAPLRESLTEAQFQRLAKALSLVYGLEVLIVLKDLWGLEFDEIRDVANWTATVLVRAAIEESAGGKRVGNEVGAVVQN